MRADLVAVILLVRHGQTTTNAQRLLVGRSDPDLTELGERQARALAPLLENVHEVWTSPLRRARRTAALALPGRDAIVKESFIEVDYGELDGQPLRSLNVQHWRDFEHGHDVAFGGGESLAQVDARVHRELVTLLDEPTSLLHDADRHLVIVSHVSPVKSAVVWALGAPPSTAWRTRIDNGSMSVIGARALTPQLIRFNVLPALV